MHDVADSARFYVDHLGFTLAVQLGDALAVLERDGLTLWVSGPSTAPAQPLPDGRVPQPGGWNRIVIEVESLVNWIDQLSTAGIHPRSAPVAGPLGVHVLVDDPSGNAIELFQSHAPTG